MQIFIRIANYIYKTYVKSVHIKIKFACILLNFVIHIKIISKINKKINKINKKINKINK